MSDQIDRIQAQVRDRLKQIVTAAAPEGAQATAERVAARLAGLIPRLADPDPAEREAVLRLARLEASTLGDLAWVGARGAADAAIQAFKDTAADVLNMALKAALVAVL